MRLLTRIPKPLFHPWDREGEPYSSGIGSRDADRRLGVGRTNTGEDNGNRKHICLNLHKDKNEKDGNDSMDPSYDLRIRPESNRIVPRGVGANAYNPGHSKLPISLHVHIRWDLQRPRRLNFPLALTRTLVLLELLTRPTFTSYNSHLDVLAHLPN